MACTWPLISGSASGSAQTKIVSIRNSLSLNFLRHHTGMIITSTFSAGSKDFGEMMGVNHLAWSPDHNSGKADAGHFIRLLLERMCLWGFSSSLQAPNSRDQLAGCGVTAHLGLPLPEAADPASLLPPTPPPARTCSQNRGWGSKLWPQVPSPTRLPPL